MKRPETTAAALERLAGGPTTRRHLPRAIPLGRNSLPRICRDLGFRRGAEIGVWRGAYSALFCAQERHGQPAITMLCVDPWISYPAWRDTKNQLPAEEAAVFMAQSYADAVARLTPFPNACIVRAFSLEAAKDVPDGSLDFVYIDGNHTFEAVTEDLEAWTPKVRAGGIVAGHDYRVFSNKPTIHVVEAVKAFVSSRGIAPWYILAGDKTPSFLWAVGA